MGLRELLEGRLATCDSEHVRTQLHHIFDKMDEPDDAEAKRRGKEHFIINEEDEEEDEEGTGIKQSEKKSPQMYEMDEGRDTMENDDDEDDMDDDFDEEDDEDDDEKMSISDFSVDDEFMQF